MTVLCGLGAVEVEGIGGGRSGDVSVEVEVIAGMTHEALRVGYAESRISCIDLRGVESVWYHGESANIIMAIGISSIRSAGHSPCSDVSVLGKENEPRAGPKARVRVAEMIGGRISIPTAVRLNENNLRYQNTMIAQEDPCCMPPVTAYHEDCSYTGPTESID